MATATAPSAAAAPPRTTAAPPLSGGGPGTVGDAARFGILTVSDRASGGVYEDLSGPAILGFFAEAVASPWAAEYRVVPDERLVIESAIIDMVRSLLAACCLLLAACCLLAACSCCCSKGASEVSI